MPLGGVDTGALYLEPSGVLGYTSIFGHITPIGGPLNIPYLGLNVGGTTYVLTTGQTKNYAGNSRPSMAWSCSTVVPMVSPCKSKPDPYR